MQIYLKKSLYKLTKIKIIYYMAVITLFIILFMHTTNYAKKSSKTNHNFSKIVSSDQKNILLKKYILLWTNTNDFPFIYFGKGNSVFVDRKCEWQNCYVTDDRNYLGDYSEFDVVAFNGPQLNEILNNDDLPKTRQAHQKYVYANIEAAVNYPICSKSWDRFFNWTWTYKLNSDAVWGYMIVKNSSGDVIAPNVHVNWISEDKMDPVNGNLSLKLRSKIKAAAWFVSNCKTMSGREEFVNELQNYLSYYNLEVDVYGDCGKFQCSKDKMKECLNILEESYYFYFAFENALSEDYVSEKILHALLHYTVPIVYGGANYTRFLPPGSYLDARELGTKNLAQKMYDIIQDHSKYRNFFRWRKYYSYHFRHESPQTDDYCQFCAMLNNDRLVTRSSIYYNFGSWWTTDESCSALLARHIDYITTK